MLARRSRSTRRTTSAGYAMRSGVACGASRNSRLLVPRCCQLPMFSSLDDGHAPDRRVLGLDDEVEDLDGIQRPRRRQPGPGQQGRNTLVGRRWGILEEEECVGRGAREREAHGGVKEPELLPVSAHAGGEGGKR